AGSDQRDRCCQCRNASSRFCRDDRSIGGTLMANFLRVGIHQSNVSGYTSKAWCIRRAGSTVFLKWGAVEVLGVGDGRKVYWALTPREKTVRCRTAQRAQDYMKAA